MARLLWRYVDAGLAFCFSRAGYLLVALSFPLGMAVTRPLEPLGMGAMAFGFFAPMVGATLLYGRYYVPTATRQPEQRYAPPPPPPPPKQPPAPPEPLVFPLLKLHTPFTRDELRAAFRRRSMELHPDHGGDAGLFRMLVAERQRAMAIAS